jgi:putative transposase
LVHDEILPVLAEPLCRFVPPRGPGPTIQKLACSGKSLPAQAARILPRTQNQTTAARQSNPPEPRLAQPLVRLAKRIDGRDAQNLYRLAPQGLPTFLEWKCQSGRPRIPLDLQRLVRRMAHENPTWGEERIANELLLKLGLCVSPRTIRTYLPKLRAPRGHPRRDQRWSTFLKNHAQAIVACDFRVVATATFRILYVFVVMNHASRRILHVNVTAHPTAAWTLQQLREAIPSDHPYRFIIHDRDSIFSTGFDASVAHLGLTAISTPVRSPLANALCERLIGTLRRECLDWIIPLTEAHLRKTLWSWLPHYNRGRPHSSLGPGLPDQLPDSRACMQRQRHRFDRPVRIVARSVLNGLHHEYNLVPRAA